MSVNEQSRRKILDKLKFACGKFLPNLSGEAGDHSVRVADTTLHSFLSPLPSQRLQLHYVVAEIVCERFAEDERGVTVADRGVVAEAGAAELYKNVL